MRRSAPASAPAERETVSVAPQPGAVTAMPTSLETGLVLQIVQLLSPARQASELAASREREALEKAERLRAALKARPEAWRDVFDLLCCLDEVDVALRVAGLLKEAVDETLERRLIDVVRGEMNRQARAVAIALLDGRRTSAGIAAVQAAADDADPRIRASALEALAGRRQEAPGVVDSILARRVQVEPDPILRDAARRLLGEQVEAAGPSAPRAKRAFGSAKIRTTR